jgi:hypothetical protein
MTRQSLLAECMTQVYDLAKDKDTELCKTKTLQTRIFKSFGETIMEIDYEDTPEYQSWADEYVNAEAQRS